MPVTLIASGNPRSVSQGVVNLNAAEEPKEQPQKQEEDPKPKTQSTLPNKSFVEPKEETKAALAAALPGQNADQPVSANAFASGANINGAQVMTGRSTSRVLAPPGGHTSIQLG